jgi:N-acetylmuramoyl-L-alanine amidase
MEIIVNEWLGSLLLKIGAATELNASPKEEPKSVPSVPPRKKVIAVCSGHSIAEPGAWSRLGAKEEVLNLQQADLIKAQLEKSGYEVRLVAKGTNDLEERGARAKGCDAFIELHHNDFDGITDPGTEVFCTRNSSKECQDAAKKVCDNICAAIKSKNRGVKLTNFTAIKTAYATGCPIVMLVESYFVNPYNQAEAEKRSAIAAMAIAKAIEGIV